MKTSVIEVQDMLSVLSVDELEKRIVEVPGVKSATVNFAAENATVRFDETRIEIADIKSAVRQRGYAPDQDEGDATAGSHVGHKGMGAATTPGPVPPGKTHEAEAASGAKATAAVQEDKEMPSIAPKSSPTAPAEAPSGAMPADAKTHSEKH